MNRSKAIFAKFKRLFLIAAFFQFTAMAANGQTLEIGEGNDTFAQWEEDQRLTFNSLPEPDGVSAIPQIVNGQVVDRKNFPTVFATSSGLGCTVTLVGPTSALVAAHCLRSSKYIYLRIGQVDVRGGCSISSTFNASTLKDDLALCVLERTVLSQVYETIDIENAPVVGRRYLLSGYGCTAAGQTSDGKFRVGFAPLTARPTGVAPVSGTIYTQASVGGDGAILCPGDSGGPLFRSGGSFNDARQIIGVNAGSRIEFGVSGFTSLASANSRTFISNWIEKYDQVICGVNKPTGCK